MHQVQTKEQFRFSPEQRDIWDVSPQAAAHSNVLAIIIEGDLKTELLRAAVQQIVSRHEILRTTFERHPGLKYPLQAINQDLLPEWIFRDLSNVPADDQERELQRRFDQLRKHRFDLENGPVLRLILTKVSDHRHELFVAVPALCGDSRSLGNFASELHTAYGAPLGKRAERERTLQYADYADWRNEILGPGAPRNGNETALNEGHVTAQEPIFRFERVPNNSHDDARYCSLLIPSDLLKRIDSLASKLQTSTPVVIFAGWQVVVQRFSGVPQLVFAYGSDGRSDPDLGGVMGPLSGWCPFRCELQESTTFSEIVSKTAQQLS